MKRIELTARERGIADYLVNRNKTTLNRISPDCVSPLIVIRQTVKADCEAIGNSLLKSESPITHDEFIRITRWINDAFFK